MKGVFTLMTSLFVWRDRIELKKNWSYQEGEGPFDVVRGLPDIYRNILNSCPFCGNYYVTKVEHHSPLPMQERTSRCERCGFDFKLFNFTVVPKNSWKQKDPVAFGNEDVDAASLKRLDINNAELGLSELGSHLKRRFGDVYALSPRRFEEFVADIYSNLGFSTRLTQQTRDGGFDIVLLEHNSGRQIIVECKRYSGGNKVGLGVVDRVLGVQLRTGIRQAKIVTTSHFTKDAIAASKQVTNFDLELVDADALLNNMEVYNEPLPPLSIHDLFRE
jgi:hypothetical protein